MERSPPSPAIVRNRLLHGDCLDILPTLSSQSVHSVLTDSPCMARYRCGTGRTVPNDDNDRWLQPAFAEIYRVLERHSFCVSFYGWRHADKFLAAFRKAGFRVVGHLTFPKRYTSRTRYLRYQ